MPNRSGIVAAVIKNSAARQADKRQESGQTLRSVAPRRSHEVEAL